MPFIHLTTGVALDHAVRSALAAEITQAMADILGKRREVTAVLIETVDPGGWFIDAQALGTLAVSPAHAAIFITAGTNTAPEKAAMVAALHEMLGRRLGSLPEASYVIIHEIAGTDWGYAGVTQAARSRQ